MNQVQIEFISREHLKIFVDWFKREEFKIN